jgi:hypothetical protein
MNHMEDASSENDSRPLPQNTTLIHLPVLTPDDPLPDLEARLAALHRLGPAEFDPGEREQIQSPAKHLGSRIHLAIPRSTMEE